MRSGDGMKTRGEHKGVLATWRDLRPYVGSSRTRLLFVGGTAALSGVVEAAVLLLLVQLALAVAKGRGLAEAALGPLGAVNLSVARLLLVAGALASLLLGLRWASAHLAARMSATAFSRVRQELFRDFGRGSWDLQAKEREGHLQELVTTHASKASMAALGIATGLASVINFGALITSAVLIRPAAAAAIAGVVAVLFFAVRPVRRLGQTYAKQQADANLEYVRVLAQGTRMAQEVRLFGVGAEFDQRVRRLGDRVAGPYFKATLIRTLVPALYRNATIFLILGGLAVVYAVGQSGAGALGAVVLIMLRALGYSQSSQVYVHQIAECAPYVEQLRDQRDLYRSNAMTRGGLRLPNIEKIAFDRVSFSYQLRQPVLEEVTFDVRRGEAIGIVGPSGVGKTTLIEVLLQLREPVTGRFVVNGRLASSFDPLDWSRKVALVPQDSRVFSGTVADNIRFFREDISAEEIEHAARQAQIHEDILSWERAYETVLGEREGAISGGQRQRLSMARALAGKPEMLVLDEPTSALDLRTERLIQETLRGLRGGLTLFIVAHRFSTLAVCDKVMVLEAGRLQAFDRPEALARSNTFYREAARLARA